MSLEQRIEVVRLLKRRRELLNELRYTERELLELSKKCGLDIDLNHDKIQR